MNRILRKAYLKIVFRLESPLMLGNGENVNSDNDLLKDKRGIPYIPGSSLAGVYRELLGGIIDSDRYFGKIADNSEETNRQSLINVFDAKVPASEIDKISISVRDSVALDEFKTAKKGAKFDAEILEPGIQFVTYVEQDYISAEDEDCLKIIAAKYASNQMYIGAKTMRGFGKLRLEKLQSVSFDMSDKCDVEKWVDFDMYNSNLFSDFDIDVAEKVLAFRIVLKQKGGISIRRYTTDLSHEADSKKAVPDYVGQYVMENGAEIPVIPGTSWAGAFRHRMEELLGRDSVAVVFGKVGEEKTKSLIRFSESKITDASEKILSRNAINRFTGGSADGALYTEKTYYSGNCVLDVSIVKDANRAIDDRFIKALAVALTDLHYGLLAIGGQTSIGRGLFEIISINENTIVTDANVFEQVLQILRKEA